MFTPLLLWYVALAICTCLSVIFRTLVSFKKNTNYFGEFDTYIVIAGFLYFGYMCIYQLNATGTSTTGEGLITSSKNNFVQSYLGKFVIVLSLGCLLLAFLFNGLINLLTGSSFTTGIGTGTVTGLGYVELIFVNCVFPICCVIEIFITDRNRTINLAVDLSAIILIVLLFSFLELVIQFNFVFSTYFKNKFKAFILRLVFSIGGYFLYDFILFKKSATGGSYSLLPQ